MNIVLIIDNYINRLNDIFNILNESKKNFANRNILIINKFFDLFLKKNCKLFLNNFFDCTRSVINSNLMFQNDTACSIQQITFNIFVFFIQTSIFFTKNKNINISKKNSYRFCNFDYEHNNKYYKIFEDLKVYAEIISDLRYE